MCIRDRAKHVEEVLAIARNFMNTGSMVGTQTQAMQAGLQAVNTPSGNGMPSAPTYNPTPQFPGANMSAQTAPTTTPAPAPVSFNPTPMPSAVPGVPGTQPMAAPSVTGVTPPVVTPKVAGPSHDAQSPNQGMNMDDILKQL